MISTRENLNFEVMKAELERAKSVLIISHRGPDGDTIGVNVALRLWLESQGKLVDSACCDPVPAVLSFLPFVADFLIEFDLDKYDCVVAVDCGSASMMGFGERYPELFDQILINFDHHPSNDNFGSINVVDSSAAAASVMMFHFLKYCGIEFEVKMAKALLTGIYYDTGSFMHSNADEEVYAIASELMSYGVRADRIAGNLFRTRSVNQLKLWGMILERARLNKEKVMVSMVTREELEFLGLGTEDLSGVIDFLNMVPEGKFALLLSEDAEGNIRGSCRTKSDEINLSKLAGLFGGGGHKKAAGFSIKGSIKEDLS